MTPGDARTVSPASDPLCASTSGTRGSDTAAYVPLARPSKGSTGPAALGGRYYPTAYVSVAPIVVPAKSLPRCDTVPFALLRRRRAPLRTRRLSITLHAAMLHAVLHGADLRDELVHT